MTKAPLTAYEAALRARMITAACTPAHQRAIKAVKEALRAPRSEPRRAVATLAGEGYRGAKLAGPDRRITPAQI